MAEIDAKPEVSAGLQSLLSEVVDYGGIFPPASLPLDEAVSNYSEYRRSEYAWMLASFIVPARRLDELEDYMHLFDGPPTLRLSVLPTGGQSGDDVLDAFEADLATVREFSRSHKHARVEQIEMPMPREFVNSDVVLVRRFLDSLDEILRRTGMEQVDVFLEIPLDGYLRQTLPLLTGAATIFNRGRSYPEVGRACVKMRTGGTESDAFPSCEDVAYLIATCRNVNVPFKSTAGLHHPIRRYDDALDTHMHGFLNVFGAAALAAAQRIDEDVIASILLDEDASHFRFSPDGFQWTHLSAPVEAIKRTRSSFALTFGSCSFMEPVEDLRVLELL